MEPFITLTAVAAPLLRDNVDTDAIIPSREMRSVSKKGLADGLFAGWRYRMIGGRDPDPSFVLNGPARDARILLTGANFGCGSSREHAVWALVEYGFRAIIAVSFNPIFRGNCLANGVVPVVLPPADICVLAEELARAPTGTLTVDLRIMEVRSAAGARMAFTLEAEAREALMAGHDPIQLTLQHEAAIRAFRDADRVHRPWVYLSAK